MNPQAGDIWEWREEDWSAVVMLVNRDENDHDNWYTICMESDVYTDLIGSNLLMCMSETYMHGWRKIA